MSALMASHTAYLFLSVDPLRRIAVRFSRKTQDVTAPATPSIFRNSLGFPNGRKGKRWRRRGGVLGEEELGGNRDLEAEIYEFMESSANPMNFPSKEALIAAGREDLARAVTKAGGWLSYGWDSDQKEEEGTANTASDSVGGRPREDSDNLCAGSDDFSGPSTSGRYPEVLQDAGIEGILIRLEKERSLAFGFISSKEKEVMMIEKEENLSMMTARHEFGNVVGGIESNGRSLSSNLDEGLHFHSMFQNSHHVSIADTGNELEPVKWQTWSIQRSGDPLTNFEAGEVVLEEEERESNLKFVRSHLVEKQKEGLSEVQVAYGTNTESHCPYDNDQGSLKNEISVSMQNLESQLTYALQFRSESNFSYEDEDQDSLLNQLHKLSDALEFQQNEIKNARDLLRSTKAKLAVLEGKIGLEVIESQNNIEEKQMRLGAAERSLSVLRFVCVVWHNSASEVLLAGSFDGWTSQRRMENNSPGVFSLCLRLYPGRYEIKFIVDGVWVVDPLRPIAYTNGFENNLLIVA